MFKPGDIVNSGGHSNYKVVWVSNGRACCARVSGRGCIDTGYGATTIFRERHIKLVEAA